MFLWVLWASLVRWGSLGLWSVGLGLWVRSTGDNLNLGISVCSAWWGAGVGGEGAERGSQVTEPLTCGIFYELALSPGFPGGSDSKESACWVWPLSQEDTREKGMATHSSIFAWEIPWTEESGELQSMGSQRIGHNWGIFTFFLSR